MQGIVCAQVFSLDQAGEWRDEATTARYAVPFFVKDQAAFRRSYPPGTRDRCGPCSSAHHMPLLRRPIPCP